MEQLNKWIGPYLSNLHMPSIHWNDVAEIIILTFVAYHILLWIKNTRAWALLKGVILILVFVLIAAICKMNTILWIVPNIFSVCVTAFIVVLQPELRTALEELGRKNIFSSLLDSGKRTDGRFSDRTINEIVKASVEMGKAKTGALIVLEQNVSLTEYERTGISVDAHVTSQLLINIFEHNTPLHDGAVLVRENRIVSATCYLPLSDNMVLSKELGTRHRAGIGVSEVTDSLTIIISEETGQISYAYRGELSRGVSGEELKARLVSFQNKTVDMKKFRLWKGKTKNEEKDSE